MGVRSLPLVTPAATGGAGVATGEVRSQPIFGVILAVGVKYLDAPPAGTTDLTLVAEGAGIGGEGGIGDQTILSIPNAATDGWFYPRADATPVGTPFTADAPVEIPVAGPLKLTAAQMNDNDQISVVIIYKD